MLRVFVFQLLKMIWLLLRRLMDFSLSMILVFENSSLSIEVRLNLRCLDYSLTHPVPDN